MRYLFYLSMSFLLFCFLWSALIYFQTGNPTQSSQWTYEAYQLKESFAQNIQKDKVVIISGSNSLFGINSALLEKEWNISVVNSAVHAGLGLPYILNRSKKLLKKGDIILLPLEYSFYQTDGRPSEVYIDFILSRDPDYFFGLPLTEKIMIIARVSCRRLYNGLKFYFNHTVKPIPGIYNIKNINAYGDQINLEPEKKTKSDFAALKILSADKIKSAELGAEFVQTMNNYISWAKNRGIDIIAMPPNHLYFNEYRSREYLKFLINIKNYYAGQNVPYIGDPYDYMYERKYYFSTGYHLNSLGIKKRTCQIIKDVGGEIGNLQQ